MIAGILCVLALPTSLACAEVGPWLAYPVPIRAIRLDRSTASWYALDGRTQANGQPHCGTRLTAAHRTLPLGSRRLLCREDRPQVCVEVEVVDRGPWVEGREWDLSRAAAGELGMMRQGLLTVVEGKAGE